MITNKIFADDIIKAEQELHALKDVYIKTASGLETIKKPVGVIDFPLTLGFGEAYCANALKVSVQTGDGTNQICMLTLEPTDSAEGYNMDDRTVNIWQTTSVGELTEYVVAVGSLNATDIQDLYDGVDVTLHYSFSVTGSSDFTISTDWIPL